MAHRLGDGPSPDAGGWRGEYTTPDGLIVLAMDEEAYDFHIDAKPGYKTAVMKHVLGVAEWHELEMLDDGECEPEILEDGTIRIYLMPKTEPRRHLSLVAA